MRKVIEKIGKRNICNEDGSFLVDKGLLSDMKYPEKIVKSILLNKKK
jgi:hypothetical protein